MSSFMTVVWIAMICAIAATAGWMFTPKGKNQALIRSSIALTITCCYLMWAITFLAQLHPLIQVFMVYKLTLRTTQDGITVGELEE